MFSYTQQGHVIVTVAEVREAERLCHEQRRFLVKLIQVDEAKAANPADIAMCARVKAAARGDFGEFENLMTFPEVGRLFNRGALHFNQPPPPKKKAR